MATIASVLAKWAEVHARLKPDVEWLAQQGWTLPMSREPRIVAELRNASGNLDEAFVRYYTRDRNANLELMWSDITRSSGLRPWCRFIAESIDSYRDRRYTITLPALLLTFEGAVVKAAHDRNAKGPKKPAERKRDELPGSIRQLVWVSIEGFIGRVFANAAFSAKRPVTLNRHWVLHGRDARPAAARRESIRLFHALHTIAVVVNRIR
jgi:hypothetical protein